MLLLTLVLLIFKPWIDHANVTALIWAGLGGTETGDALVDMLYGVFGFGLSYTTFEYSSLSIIPVVGGQDLVGALEANWATGKASPQVVGSSTALWLHRPVFSMSFTEKNTGAVAGTEIPQVYLHFPAQAGEPPSVLHGFADADLQPGQVQSITITLSRYDLSIWDIVSQSWICPSRTYSLSVGASSRDFRLKGKIPL
ncbi:fibronectin type III-like domain-containing protein [Lactarius pseudohatsudake]|nr:fibronectin type III-like domain-containing protein [Lactarius pseudohatsudake]